MSKHKIKYADSSVEIKTQLPDSYGDITSGSVLIKDLDGDDLDSGSLAIATATTLNGAMSRGASSAVLTSVTGYDVDDVVRVAGATGTEQFKILGIDVANKTLTFDKRADYAHEDGAAVSCRHITYVIDASDTDVFLADLEFVILWGVDSDGDPDFDTDDPPHRELGIVAKRLASHSGLEQQFRSAYQRYVPLVVEGHWNDLVSLAHTELRNLFLLRDRDIDKVVDTDRIAPLLLLQIAYHLASTGDSGFNDESERLMRRRDMSLDGFARAAIWQDIDQDDVMEDHEIATAVRALPRRVFFG